VRIPRPRKFEVSPLDIAPLIDVVLLLLIFFMLTSPLVRQFGIRVALPQVASPDTTSPRAVKLRVTEDDRLLFRGSEIPADRLVEVLAGVASGGRPVQIVGDRRCSLGRVTEIWDACKSAGVRQVSIGVQLRRRAESSTGETKP
jgi:biopolymer transport protein ExbD